MSQAIVRQELEARTFNWASNYPTPIKVSIENVPFQKPTDYSAWVRATLLPVPTIDVTVDGKRQRYSGIFYIYVWVRDGQGSGEGEAIVDSIVKTFSLVPKVGNVSIEKTPSAGNALFEDGWRVIPVTINYRYES